MSELEKMIAKQEHSLVEKTITSQKQPTITTQTPSKYQNQYPAKNHSKNNKPSATKALINQDLHITIDDNWNENFMNFSILAHLAHLPKASAPLSITLYAPQNITKSFTKALKQYDIITALPNAIKNVQSQTKSIYSLKQLADMFDSNTLPSFPLYRFCTPKKTLQKNLTVAIDGNHIDSAYLPSSMVQKQLDIPNSIFSIERLPAILKTLTMCDLVIVQQSSIACLCVLMGKPVILQSNQIKKHVVEWLKKQTICCSVDKHSQLKSTIIKMTPNIFAAREHGTSIFNSSVDF